MPTLFSQQPSLRQGNTPDFVAAQKKTASVKTGGTLREIQYRHKGTLTVAGASNTAAATLRGDELAVLKRATLTVNNDITLIDRTGDEWWWINYFTLGVFPDVTPAIGDGATLNPTFDISLPLLLWQPGMDRPWDTVLETHKHKNVDLSFEWGLANGTDVNAAATVVSVTPTVTVDDSTGGPDDPDPRAGLMHDYFFQSREQKTPTGVTSTFDFDLTTANRIYTHILVNTRTAGGVDDDAIVNSMTLFSGPKTYFRQDWKAQQQVYRQKRRLQPHYDFSAAAFNQVRRGNKSHPKGWCMIELPRTGSPHDGGYITEGVDSRSLNELKLRFDVAAAGDIIILPMGRIPMIGVGRDPSYQG